MRTILMVITRFLSLIFIITPFCLVAQLKLRSADLIQSFGTSIVPDSAGNVLLVVWIDGVSDSLLNKTPYNMLTISTQDRVIAAKAKIGPFDLQTGELKDVRIIFEVPNKARKFEMSVTNFKPLLFTVSTSIKHDIDSLPSRPKSK